MRHLILLALVCMSYQCNAQQYDTPAYIEGGTNQLVLDYYDVEFTPYQLNQLSQRELAFIYNVSKEGAATLENVKGIDNESIINKFKAVKVPTFVPAKKDNQPVSSIYILNIYYPSYTQNGKPSDYTAFNMLEYEDFEYIKTKNRFSMTVGGIVNHYFGNASKYMNTGGGFKMGYDYTFTPSNLTLDLGINAYFNGRKENFPITLEKPEDKVRQTFIVGLGAGRKFGDLKILGRIDYVHSGIVTNKENSDYHYSIIGWSPGISMSYDFKIGGYKTRPNYIIAPTVERSNVTIHAGLRRLNMKLKEASGMMAEIGISYNVGSAIVKDYRVRGE